jgi:hypothetical protein
MNTQLEITALLAVASILALARMYRSGMLIPIGALILLPAVPLNLATVAVAGKSFNFTIMDICFIFCVLSLLFRKRAMWAARSTMHPGVWKTATGALQVMVVLMSLNFLANLIYQPWIHLVWSSLILFRTYCQPFILCLYVLVFLRGNALKGVAMILFSFSFLGLIQAGLQETLWESRATPFGMNPNAFGQAQALILLAAFSIYIIHWGGRLVANASLVAIFAAGLGIIISGSRESLISASAGMVFILFKTSYEKRPMAKLGKILLAALFFLAAYQATNRFHARFENNVFHRMEAIMDAKDLGVDRNYSARTRLWRDTIQFYASRPLFIVLGRGIPMYGADTNWLIIDGDSAYLSTINCVGIIGLSFILWFLTRIWLLSVFLKENNPDADKWSSGAQAAILTYCILGVAANVFGSPHTTMVFLLTAFMPLVGMGTLAVPMNSRAVSSSQWIQAGRRDGSWAREPSGD